MPNLVELKNTIVSYSPNQVAYSNDTSEVKIHTTVHVPMELRADKTLVDNTNSSIEGLSAEDFATLQGSLPDDMKLSGRPC